MNSLYISLKNIDLFLQALNRLNEIEGKIYEEKLTVEDQKELYGAIFAASAMQLRDGKILQEKMADVKQKPVVVKMYEELQEKSTALLVNVEPDPASKEIEDVRWCPCINFLDKLKCLYMCPSSMADYHLINQGQRALVAQLPCRRL